jgi:hypothetical protein
MREEVKNVDIEGRAYLGQRVTDEVTKIDFIEIWDPETGDPVARATYDGDKKQMRLATFGHALPENIVLEILKRARFALA